MFNLLLLVLSCFCQWGMGQAQATGTLPLNHAQSIRLEPDVCSSYSIPGRDLQTYTITLTDETESPACDLESSVSVFSATEYLNPSGCSQMDLPDLTWPIEASPNEARYQAFKCNDKYKAYLTIQSNCTRSISAQIRVLPEPLGFHGHLFCEGFNQAVADHAESQRSSSSNSSNRFKSSYSSNRSNRTEATTGGTVGGGLFFIFVVAGIVACCCCAKKRNQQQLQPQPVLVTTQMATNPVKTGDYQRENYDNDTTV